ncbi:sugar phosphate isomerase/epimerase [Brachybacterium sp. MASK1Z-5]|uniref:Sugar phosphate isomerase/epimerase n=1 Tax=Brachybacterium halotolerans TaxID=2795215 RepID=A0ABS1B8M8_9MICO|nr:sugar phosphate isomerase/epimerase [Brachybacterium halotolerans]MBK0331008.1 sugar phosphate isomerase/epimerase [Brachybacterium halotolerans]
MIRPGLCSITFRDLTAEQLIDLARRAGLACIEWGGDVHAPPGDTETAERVRLLTEQAGLSVASYGSYLRFTGDNASHRADADAVLASARALHAPRIRVWAGGTGSRRTPTPLRAQAARRIREFATRAGEHGIDLGLEFHRGTLTDEIGSTMRLLDEVAADNVRTYWQPHQDMPDDDALQTLRTALPRTSTIHVFSWWPGASRLPLAERADLWCAAFSILEAEGSDRDALLEFVPNDDPAVLDREAATLRELIEDGRASTP